MLKIKSKAILAFAGLMVAAFVFSGAMVASADMVTLPSAGISKASSKENVKNLQTFLNWNLGSQIVPLVVDGLYGAKTTAAIKLFQAGNSLTADGIFGKLSTAKANALSAGGSVSTVPGCTSTVGFSPTTGASCASGVVTTPTPTTGPVAVALASDTPAASSFIVTASGVEFAKYAFTGNGTVTSVKLMRTGVSSSSTVSNVYLYDGATRLTDGASIGSDNTVTFNSLSGLFTVAGSKTITVVADTAVADYSLGFNLVGYTANGVASTANVAGNQLFGASATLSVLTMSSATGSGNTDAGTEINVWQGTASNSTRDVILKRLALRQVGSIASADINNFKLYVDGVLVSSVMSLDSNGYVTFAPNTVLKTGARVFKVTADVIGGAGRTVQMSLRGAFDVVATDTQYNANGVTSGTFPFGPSAFTVNSGTLTVIKKSNSPSTNVTLGASDQNLATYTFTAYGEPVKVETLRVGMITTGGTVTEHTLRNVRILVNGAQVGSNTSVPAAASFAAASGTSFTTNFIVYPGTPATVEIHSDIYDNEDTDNIAAGTVTAVQAVLVGGSSTSNAIPQVSLGTINVPSASNVLGNNLTIASGSMTLAKTSSYADRSIAVPTTAYKIGSFQLTGNATEAVNLNTIYVGFADTTSDAAPATDLTDLYVVYGGTMSPVKGTVTCTYSAGCTNPNSWSINRTLAVNETLSIDVYATVASTLSTNSFISTLAIAGTTANSGIATYADASGNTSLTAGVSGQEITGATGSVTMSQDASTAVAQIVDDSGTLKTLTAKIVALTDSYTVTDMTVTITNASAVSAVVLKDSTTGAIIGASKPGATSLTWSGLTYEVAAGETKKIDVELTLAPVGVSAGTTDSALTTAITAFTARNSGGTSATGTGTATGNAIYIYKALPTISVLALPNTSLSVSEMVIAKFTVSTNGTGTIAWKQAMFEVTKSLAPTLTSPTLWNSETGLQVNAFMEFQNGSTTPGACGADNTTCEIRVTIDAAS
ncbi:peptidoglycan-binding protein, partial [Candidatus Nomurabacteria bacterium]|nr:peptidoglycan-binding protein [Candidatus Nomurabacteria bacterium]